MEYDQKQMPPALRQFAAEDGLTDEELQAYYQASLTIRGKPPQTVEEWRNLWNIIKDLYYRQVEAE